MPEVRLAPTSRMTTENTLQAFPAVPGEIKVSRLPWAWFEAASGLWNPPASAYTGRTAEEKAERARDANTTPDRVTRELARLGEHIRRAVRADQHVVIDFDELARLGEQIRLAALESMVAPPRSAAPRVKPLAPRSALRCDLCGSPPSRCHSAMTERPRRPLCDLSEPSAGATLATAAEARFALWISAMPANERAALQAPVRSASYTEPVEDRRAIPAPPVERRLGKGWIVLDAGGPSYGRQPPCVSLDEARGMWRPGRSVRDWTAGSRPPRDRAGVTIVALDGPLSREAGLSLWIPPPLPSVSQPWITTVLQVLCEAETARIQAKREALPQDIGLDFAALANPTALQLEASRRLRLFKHAAPPWINDEDVLGYLFSKYSFGSGGAGRLSEVEIARLLTKPAKLADRVRIDGASTGDGLLQAYGSDAANLADYARRAFGAIADRIQGRRCQTPTYRPAPDHRQELRGLYRQLYLDQPEHAAEIADLLSMARDDSPTDQWVARVQARAKIAPAEWQGRKSAHIHDEEEQLFNHRISDRKEWWTPRWPAEKTTRDAPRLDYDRKAAEPVRHVDPAANPAGDLSLRGWARPASFWPGEPVSMAAAALTARELSRLVVALDRCKKSGTKPEPDQRLSPGSGGFGSASILGAHDVPNEP